MFPWQFTGTHFNSRVERSIGRVKPIPHPLPQKHNTMIQPTFIHSVSSLGPPSRYYPFEQTQLQGHLKFVRTKFILFLTFLWFNPTSQASLTISSTFTLKAVSFSVASCACLVCASTNSFRVKVVQGSMCRRQIPSSPSPTPVILLQAFSQRALTRSIACCEAFVAEKSELTTSDLKTKDFIYFNLTTLTSVCIFSILFSIHFQKYWWEEFVS